jgi:hypothetical protein
MDPVKLAVNGDLLPILHSREAPFCTVAKEKHVVTLSQNFAHASTVDTTVISIMSRIFPNVAFSSNFV